MAEDVERSEDGEFIAETLSLTDLAGRTELVWLPGNFRGEKRLPRFPMVNSRGTVDEGPSVVLPSSVWVNECEPDYRPSMVASSSEKCWSGGQECVN